MYACTCIMRGVVGSVYRVSGLIASLFDIGL